MARDQAGQLQRLALADGVDPLRVALLLDVARQARVHDAHGGGGCKTQREKAGEHRQPPGPGRSPAPSPRSRGLARSSGWELSTLSTEEEEAARVLLAPRDPLGEACTSSFALGLFLFRFPKELSVIVLFIIDLSKCITTLIMQIRCLN